MSNSEQNEILTLDLLWSFFFASLNSFRYDSVLRPFPQQYIDRDNEEKDIKQVRDVASDLPPVSEVLDQPDTIHPESLELFKWATSSPNFKLVHKDKSEFDEILKLTKQEGRTAAPNYIFEVIHSENRELRFQNCKKGRDTVYAYHGSRLENFYSILRNGLVSHMCKNGAFGSGTYFSSELGVSFNFSLRSMGWTKSCIGHYLSCIAVCEIVKDSALKYHSKRDNDKSLPFSEDLMHGKIPEKYFLACNDDLVQLRYLLIYAFGSKQNKLIMSRWWRKNLLAIFGVSYFLILVAIGLSKWSGLVAYNFMESTN